MNKLLASIVVLTLLVGLVSIPLSSAYADKDAMKEKVKDKAKDKVKDKVKDKAKDKVKDKVKDKAKDKVKDKVKDKAKDKAKDKTKDKVKEKMTAKKDDKASDTSKVTVEMAVGSGVPDNCTDDCYIPNNVQIPVGGTVVWKNIDTAAHTATSVDAFDTGLVNAGASASQKFDTAGTYNYICIVHPWMQGTVTVS